MNNSRLEMMVGFFVLLAVLIFFIIIFFVSGIYFLREGYNVRVDFDYVSGLERGAPVKMAGVRVGEVNSVEIEYDAITQKPKAEVELWLKKGIEVRECARAYIFGAFALNEMHIEIISEGSKDGRVLQDGDSLVGVAPIPMERFMDKGMEITEGIATITEKINAIMGDEKMQTYMQQTIIDMSELLSMMNRLMKEQDQDLNLLVDNVEGVAHKMNSVLGAIESGEGTLGQLLMNDELYQEMKAFVREIKLHPWRLMKRDKKSKEERKVLGIF